jgi:hypothetical protein
MVDLFNFKAHIIARLSSLVAKRQKFKRVISPKHRYFSTMSHPNYPSYLYDHFPIHYCYNLRLLPFGSVVPQGFGVRVMVHSDEKRS